MGLIKRFLNFLGVSNDTEPRERETAVTPKGRVTDSRTSIPADAQIEIVRAWSPVKGDAKGRYKNAPWRGWRDDDIVDENQVLVHVTSNSNGVDYYRTIMGPFANNAIDSIMDLVNAEFWNSSP